MTDLDEADSSLLTLEAKIAGNVLQWEDIYKSFKKFRKYDDGYIAEGYSDIIVRMLAYRWNKLGWLVKLTSSDKDFYAFVLRHIDATTEESDIKKIIKNSNKHCPVSYKTMCSAINKAAKKALRAYQDTVSCERRLKLANSK